ncbi:hypothetical protein [Oceanicoccus sp. KOV_DT_Chl]|uniref:hypothetical protein n=1 Tax=Oceanicoccus sp. KOV_DT_Chl TaxID=1904639 RepID=UPI000C7E501A|nr:hypothetical protein [Oceanicoccus sp. KOV_DT_Chl]
MAISIPWFKQSKTRSGRVGLSFGPDGIGIAAVNSYGAVVFCQFIDQLGETAELLAEVIEQQGWQKMPCSLVLHPVYYQLLLAECPAVASDEMSAAVRWKVKDLLDFPLADAAIEYFLLPEDAYRGRQKMLYAAALRKAALQSLVQPVEESDLIVDCVEIAELALHNIVSRLPREGGGIALLQLHAGEGFINLVENGAIYLTRRLDIGLDGFNAERDNTRFFDSLFLEVQRSLDYYESQLGKGIITRLFYSPALDETVAIGDFLSMQLGLNVAALDLSGLEILTAEVGLDNRCVSAVGAALGPFNAQEATRAAS